MLKYSADIKTLAYLTGASALFFVQWNLAFNPALFVLSLYLAISVAVIAHNHNHVPIWKSAFLNNVTNNWITLLYGFPAFAWKPTHNINHHKLNNREGDYTITYRYSEKNNLVTLLTYPSISSYFQQGPVKDYLRHLYRNKRQFWLSILQYLVLIVFIGATLLMDWRKSLLYVVIPQQTALFTIMIFNYIQHVHADEESDYNHSRNFTSRFTNFMMFNNGFHTIHHLKAGMHWSELPAAHAKIAHLIEPHLNEPTIIGYLLKTYIFAPRVFARKTASMRVIRIRQREERKVAAEQV